MKISPVFSGFNSRKKASLQTANSRNTNFGNLSLKDEKTKENLANMMLYDDINNSNLNAIQEGLYRLDRATGSSQYYLETINLSGNNTFFNLYNSNNEDSKSVLSVRYRKNGSLEEIFASFIDYVTKKQEQSRIRKSIINEILNKY